MLGFVGGIFELFKIVGEVFSSYFISWIFYSSILQKFKDSEECDNVHSNHHLSERKKKIDVTRIVSKTISKENQIYPIRQINYEVVLQSVVAGCNLEEEDKSSININQNMSVDLSKISHEANIDNK